MTRKVLRLLIITGSLISLGALQLRAEGPLPVPTGPPTPGTVVYIGS
jgi:hypothetical protein